MLPGHPAGPPLGSTTVFANKTMNSLLRKLPALAAATGAALAAPAAGVSSAAPEVRLALNYASSHTLSLSTVPRRGPPAAQACSQPAIAPSLAVCTYSAFREGNGCPWAGRLISLNLHEWPCLLSGGPGGELADARGGGRLRSDWGRKQRLRALNLLRSRPTAALGGLHSLQTLA